MPEGAHARGLVGVDFAALEFPPSTSTSRCIARATGRDRIDHFEYYVAYNMFRLAAILQGVMARALQGGCRERRSSRSGTARARSRKKAGGRSSGCSPRGTRGNPWIRIFTEDEGAAGESLSIHERARGSRGGIPRGGGGQSRRRRSVETDARGRSREKARAQGLWNLFLPESERARGLPASVRAAVQIMGRSGDRAGVVQLQRARHRQHGSAGALRHARAEEAVAAAAPRGAHPLGLRHDGARCGLLGRDQHRGAHRARRRHSS